MLLVNFSFIYSFILTCSLPTITNPPSTSLSGVDFFESLRSPNKLHMINLCKEKPKKPKNPTQKQKKQ